MYLFNIVWDNIHGGQVIYMEDMYSILGTKYMEEINSILLETIYREDMYLNFFLDNMHGGHVPI